MSELRLDGDHRLKPQDGGVTFHVPGTRLLLEVAYETTKRPRPQTPKGEPKSCTLDFESTIMSWNMCMTAAGEHYVTQSISGYSLDQTTTFWNCIFQECCEIPVKANLRARG